MSILIKAKTKVALLKEGNYQATLTTVTLKPNDTDPKKVHLEFEIDGTKQKVSKEHPASFEEDSTLRRDAETLLKREFLKSEAEAGFDPKLLEGKRATITVAHRGGPGGKLTPSVTVIQAPDTSKPMTTEVVPGASKAS